MRSTLLGSTGLFVSALGLHTMTFGADGPVAPFDFQGRLLVAVSDADMVPSAYLNGRLGPAQGVDALSVVRLDRVRSDWLRRAPGATRAAQVPVSNSVTGPPAVVATTPDGRYAVVVETLGPRPAHTPAAAAEPRLRDLPLGRTIAVIDLSDPDRPAVVQRLACPEQPETVSINAAGSLVAVTFGPQGAGRTTPLVLYRFRDGRLASPTTPVIPGWLAGHNLRDAEFGPRDNTLALLDATAPAVSFVQVSDDGARLTRWGNAVGVEALPFLVRFTPDGRHVVVNATYGTADAVDGGFGAPRGTVATIRVAADRDADGAPRHAFVSHAATGVVPEGFAVSPDGRWVATTNLERTAAPFDDPRQGLFASLTLLRLDPASGVLERVGDFPFDGVMPETVLFDNSSRYLATTSFDRFDGARPGGSIDFWRLAGDRFDPTRVALVRTNTSIPVTRGAHTMVLVR